MSNSKLSITPITIIMEDSIRLSSSGSLNGSIGELVIPLASANSSLVGGSSDELLGRSLVPKKLTPKQNNGSWKNDLLESKSLTVPGISNGMSKNSNSNLAGALKKSNSNLSAKSNSNLLVKSNSNLSARSNTNLSANSNLSAKSKSNLSAKSKSNLSAKSNTNLMVKSNSNLFSRSNSNLSANSNSNLATDGKSKPRVVSRSNSKDRFSLVNHSMDQVLKMD